MSAGPMQLPQQLPHPWLGHRGRWLLGVALFSGLIYLLVCLPVRPLLGLIALGSAGVISLRRPWLLWVGLGIVLPVTSGIKLGALSASDLILVGGVALWFADGVRRRTLQVTPHPLLLGLAIFIGVLYLSLLQATDVREALVEVLKWAQFALVLLLVPTMLPRNGAQWLVVGLLLGGLLQGLLGIYQFIFRIGPEWFIILGRFMRASGTFNQPNPYAGYLGLTLPVAVSLGLWSLNHLRRQPTQAEPPARPYHTPGSDSLAALERFPPSRRHSSITRHQSRGVSTSGSMIDSKWRVPSLRISAMICMGFMLGATAIIGLGLLASWSRGGWLGAAGAVAVVIALRSRQAALLSGVAALILGGTLLVGVFGSAWIPDPIAARFADIPAYFGLTDVLNEPLTNENFAIVERIAHWVAAVRMWERAPWLGVGPGNYGVVYPEVRLPLWEEPLGHAHNIYLNLLAESGLLGLLAYLALWLAILIWLWQQYRRAIYKGDWQAPLVLGVIGVVVHLSIHNFFDNLFVQGSYLHIALWLAAVSQLSRSAGDNRQIASKQIVSKQIVSKQMVSKQMVSKQIVQASCRVGIMFIIIGDGIGYSANKSICQRKSW